MHPYGLFLDDGSSLRAREMKLVNIRQPKDLQGKNRMLHKNIQPPKRAFYKLISG